MPHLSDSASPQTMLVAPAPLPLLKGEEVEKWGDRPQPQAKEAMTMLGQLGPRCSVPS